jgi:prefoldin beta subunit
METQKENDKPKESKIQELQMLEQGLQNTLMQKQAFQMELSEAQAALKELKNSGDEVFKIIGQLMIKSEKSKISEDLENKEKILKLRISTLEKQEISLTEKFEALRKEII